MSAPAHAIQQHDVPFTPREETTGGSLNYAVLTNNYSGYNKWAGMTAETDRMTSHPEHYTQHPPLPQQPISSGVGVAIPPAMNNPPPLTELAPIHPQFDGLNRSLRSAHIATGGSPMDTMTTTSNNISHEDVVFLQLLGLSLERLSLTQRLQARAEILQAMWRVQFPLPGTNNLSQSR